jgi:tight adherence protein C
MVMTPELMLVALWFCAAASFVLLVALVWQSAPSAAQARVAELARQDRDVTPGGAGPGLPAGPPPTLPDRAWDRHRRSDDRPHDLRDRIVQAGIYHQHAPVVFLVLRIALFASMMGLGLLASHLRLLSPWPAVVAGTLAGLAATLAPSLWLDHIRRLRQTQMRRALPDALDLMGVCLQGGLSLPGALARVSQELGTAHPMLALELAIVEREMQMGLSAGQAMRQMARRFDLEELRSLSSVVGQAERFGSSVTQALRTYAEGLRIKRHQQAEEMAQKAAVKILFPTLFCIFPGIFLVVLGPAAIRIYQVLLAGNAWGGGG